MLKRIISFGVVILIILAIFGISKQISKALVAAKRLDEAADNLNNLQEENKNLKKILSEVGSGGFIEQQARNKLNMARPGETVVVIPQKEIDKVLGLKKELEWAKQTNWQMWLQLFFP